MNLKLFLKVYYGRCMKVQKMYPWWHHLSEKITFSNCISENVGVAFNKETTARDFVVNCRVYNLS